MRAALQIAPSLVDEQDALPFGHRPVERLAVHPDAVEVRQRVSDQHALFLGVRLHRLAQLSLLHCGRQRVINLHHLLPAELAGLVLHHLQGFRIGGGVDAGQPQAFFVELPDAPVFFLRAGAEPINVFLLFIEQFQGGAVISVGRLEQGRVLVIFFAGNQCEERKQQAQAADESCFHKAKAVLR